MLDSQLRTSGVSAPWVLDRMASVARETFVPPAMQAAAYSDRAVPLGGEQFLAAPLFHGLMLQEARPAPGDRVCIVSGDGRYLAALLQPVVAGLRVLTPTEALAGPADSTEAADLLLVDGAAETLPPAVVALVREGGRVVAGLLEGGVARLAAGERMGDTLALLPIAEMGIPRLAQFDKPRTWHF